MIGDRALGATGRCDYSPEPEAQRDKISRAEYNLSRQTRDINLVLVQCWTSVADAEPTLFQHCIYISCLLGSLYPIERKMLSQCWFDVEPASKALVQQQIKIRSMYCVSREKDFWKIDKIWCLRTWFILQK